jgi:hypothetical protein
MSMSFVKLTADNIEEEHICCVIADKKHQDGITTKKSWLEVRIKEEHVFFKLNKPFVS